MKPIVNLTLTFSVGDTMMIIKPNKHGQFENVVVIADDGDVRSVPIEDAVNILSAFFKAREKRAGK